MEKIKAEIKSLKSLLTVFFLGNTTPVRFMPENAF